MTADEVTAVIVTRGDVSLDPILEALPYPEVIVWNNAEHEWDAKVYGRYLAAEQAQTEYVYFGDDDLIFRNHEALLAAWEPDLLVVNMPSPWYESCSYDVLGQALVGAGSLCPVGYWHEAFDRYNRYWPQDELFLNYCDFIFGRLVPHRRYDFGYEPLPYCDASGRIFNHPEARQRRSLIFARTSLLKGEYGAAWYDEVMVEEGSPAMVPLEDSPWLELYQELAKLIDPWEPIVDLGCGTGRFLQLLYEQGHYGPITGVDWSQAALKEAARVAVPIHEAAPLPTWINANLYDWQPDLNAPPSTVYVCSEVLEHVEDDIAIVSKIPPGYRLLISVPNFHDQAHVRVFRKAPDLWQRYDQMLDIRRWQIVGNRVHLAETRRRL